MPDAKPRPIGEILMLTLLASLWGASYTFIRIGVASIPPVTLIAGRTLIAGTVLLVVIRVRRLPLPCDAATWGAFAVQSLLNCVCPFTLIAMAERSVGAGLATILNATSPVFAFLFSFALTQGQSVSGRKLLGVVLGLAGTCLVVGVDALQGLGHDVWSQIAIVAASACYGGAALFGRSFRALDPLLPAAGSMACGAVLLVPLSLAIDRPWTLLPTTSSLLALLMLSTVSTALALVLYFRLIRTLGAVATTAQAYLRVPFGVAIGVAALGERLSPTAWFGLGAIVCGVAAMSLPPTGPGIGTPGRKRRAIERP